MKLEDLIDLEAQIAADEDQEPATLRARDREIYAKLKVDPNDRPALLGGWVAALRAASKEKSLGQRVATGYRALAYLLVAAAIGLGWSTASVLLHYEQGETPVNVGNYLLLVIGVQIALLALLLVGVPLLRAFPNMPVVGDLRAFLRWVAFGLEKLMEKADDQLAPETRELWKAARHRLRTRASIYQSVEQWILLGMTQLFGTFFNLAVLACCLRLVFFSDLVFAWSTTAETVDTATVHEIVSSLATPWGWLWPAAVPSYELVENSQYSRLNEAYAGAPEGRVGDAALVGGWWSFMLAATITYGLLPRFLLLITCRIARARSLATLPLTNADVDKIVRRLRAPRVETRARQADTARAEAAPEGAREPAALSQPRNGKCAVVLWRDLPTGSSTVTDAVRVAFGWEVTRSEHAGGLDYDADLALCRDLAGSEDRILVLAEGWEAPDKSIRRFLTDLREAAGEERSLLVALVNDIGEQGWEPATKADVAIWRNRLTLLEDPYLGVEALEASHA